MPHTFLPLHAKWVNLPLFIDRVVPESGADTVETVNPINLIFVVGFALLISLLARYISRRGRRR